MDEVISKDILRAVEIDDNFSALKSRYSREMYYEQHFNYNVRYNLTYNSNMYVHNRGVAGYDDIDNIESQQLQHNYTAVQQTRVTIVTLIRVSSYR